MAEAWIGGKLVVTANEHSVTVEIKGGGNKVVLKQANMISLAQWLTKKSEGTYYGPG